MELKCSFTLIFLLLLLLLLAAPSFSSSSGKMDLSNVDSGIYDIDYRGPETHITVPPPRGGRHNSHHQGMLFHHKATKPGKRGKKNHG